MPMLDVMTPPWGVQMFNSLMNALQVILVAGIGGWVSVKIQALKTQGDKAALETTKVGVQMGDLAKVTLASHTLLNSERGELLRKMALKSRETADVTGRAEDIAEADEDWKTYQAHEAAQRTVNAQLGSDAQKSGRGSGAP